MRTFHIARIAGDGIGPEIVREACKVLAAAGEAFGFSIAYEDLLLGGASIDACGVPITDETVERAGRADAVLMGSIGGDAATSPWYRLEPERRPEAGLLRLRKSLGLFANLRPASLFPQLRDSCPLKDAVSGAGFDLLILRELTGGLYFGPRKTVTEQGVRKATDTLVYDEREIRRVAVRGFALAQKRRGKLTSVDKANVLDASRLWRAVVEDVHRDYPDVALSHMLVDNCAMQLIRDPGQFDVILTENLFGDILSDEASMLTGSIGMLPSASLSETAFGLYEPAHGSAPDIAGKDVANPIAAILSSALLLRHSLCQEAVADAIERAVGEVLSAGFRTPDIWSPGKTRASCSQMGSLIAEKVGAGQMPEKRRANQDMG